MRSGQCRGIEPAVARDGSGIPVAINTRRDAAGEQYRRQRARDEC